MISKDTIDKIFDTAIIEDVIGEFVVLKKSGSSYKGLSPFTKEKTPSFFVVPHKGIYKCFSSNKGGNVVSFLMEHEKLSYPEALRWLAAKYQIEIEEDEQTEEQLEAKSERESLSLINEFAQKTFVKNMFETDEGKSIGLGYFRQRGFTDQTIEKFGLGYCLDQWDGFTKLALEKEYQLKYLLKAGLSKERNGSPYDFFKGRVIFPIRNVSGKTIAFGARTLKSDKKIPKYLNSPENELYVKSNSLYGLYQAKKEIVNADNCFLVEGYTDVISLHQAGVENVVASGGTSLTQSQIRKIKRYSQNITILYDGDAAGIRASFRGIDMILQEGMNVRVVLFPEGEDPDSYSQSVSTPELHHFLKEHAKDFLVFKSDLLKEEAQNDPIKRAEMVREIVASIALIPDAIKREIYTRECSDLLEVEENTLILEINKMLRKKAKKDYQVDIPPPPEAFIPQPKQVDQFERINSDSQEMDLIRLMLNYGNRIISFENPVEVSHEKVIQEEVNMTVSEYLIEELENDHLDLHHPVCSTIFKEYSDHVHRGEFPGEKYFTQHHDLDVSKLSTDLVTSQYELSHNWTMRHRIYPETEDLKLKRAVETCAYRFKLRLVQLLIQDVSDQIKHAEENNDHDRLENLLSEKIVLDKAKAELSSFFGTAII